MDARSKQVSKPVDDLEGYHFEVTICENGIFYDLWYNDTEKDCTKAWKRVAK